MSGVKDPPEKLVANSSRVGAVETHAVLASSIKAPTFRLDAAHYRQQFIKAAHRALSTGLPVRKVRDMANAFVPDGPSSSRSRVHRPVPLIFALMMPSRSG
jgi:hypothetical protein